MWLCVGAYLEPLYHRKSRNNDPFPQSYKSIYINGKISNGLNEPDGFYLPRDAGGRLTVDYNLPITNPYFHVRNSDSLANWQAGTCFPLYIGKGPRSQFTGNSSWYQDLNETMTPYHYVGLIDELKICEGYRYALESELTYMPREYIEVPGVSSTTTTTTTTTSTTTTLTTETSTTTTTSTTGSGTTISSTSETATTETSTTTTTTTTTGTTTSTTTTFTTYSTQTAPQLYEDVTEDGYAVASHFYPGSEPEKAFDKDMSVYWSCDPWTGPPYWITYYWTDGRRPIVDEYRVFLIGAGRPKKWRFQGSLDGEAWVTLDEQLESLNEGLVVRRISSPSAYPYYRFYVLGIYSRSFAVQINEIRLFSNARYYPPEDTMDWVGYSFPTAKRPEGYCLFVREASTFDKWKLQGSDDGAFWFDVDYRYEPDFVGWKCFVIQKPASYKMWRILIMHWKRWAMTKGLVEFELFDIV